MTAKGVFIWILAIAMLIPVILFAEDSERTGFIFGLDVGLGKAKQSATAGDADISVSQTGYLFGWRLGGGPREDLWIYWQNQLLLFEAPYMDVEWDGYGDEPYLVEKESWFMQGLSGVGVTYFLEPVAPSFFATGLLGMGYLFGPFDDIGFDMGMGYQIGIGYEFARQFFVEGSYMHTTVGDDALDEEFDLSISNWALAVGWRGY